METSCPHDIMISAWITCIYMNDFYTHFTHFDLLLK